MVLLPLVIGERLGPYRIVELLGQGGLAEVYRAYHQDQAKDVAIKVLRSTPDEHTRQRFQREAEALTSLQHPNIIQVLGAGEHEGRPYYTMPFVRVLSLGEMMRQRFQVDQARFSQDEILRVLADTARALRYAHGRGIIHRDVKPGNILMDPNFRPVLCDFGLARLGGHETMTNQGTMLGTPRYMAPEQLQGRRCDGRSDLYSLGLVAYELATGSIPFDGGEPLAAAVRRLTESIPPLGPLAPHLDPVLADVIFACLANTPNQRPENAGALLRVLAGLPGVPAPLSGEDSVDPTIEQQSLSIEEEIRKQPIPFAVSAGLGVAALIALPAYLLLKPAVVTVDAQARLEPRATAATLRFHSDHPVRLGVRYGPPGRLVGYLDSAAGSALEHTIELDALRPDTEYEFVLILDGDGSPHQEPPRRFRTAPSPNGSD